MANYDVGVPPYLSAFVASYVHSELVNNDDALILQYLLKKNIDKPTFKENSGSNDVTDGNNIISVNSRPSFAEKCATLLLTALEDEQDVEAEDLRPNQFYTEQLLPFYSDIDFKCHFKMKRSTFESLLELLGKEGLAKTAYAGGRPPITLERLVTIFLSWLVNQESHKEVSARFNVAKSTIHSCISRVSLCLHQIAHRFIRWPEEHEMQLIAGEFQQRAGFPGVIGAIGSTHVEVDVPIVYHQRYNNDKQAKTMVLQAVCNANYYFTNCFAGFPGSIHESCVFENSALIQEIQRDPDRYVGGNRFHIIGDSSYPLYPWMIVPFVDNGDLTKDQLRFNAIHAQTVLAITTAFSQLRHRFRRLQYVKAKLDYVPGIIISSCVLHNFCINNDDCLDDHIEFPQDIIECDSQVDSGGTELGFRKRSQILTYV